MRHELITHRSRRVSLLLAWIAGCCFFMASSPIPTHAHPGHGDGSASATGYVEALKESDTSIRYYLDEAAKQPNSWSRIESAANACVERAELSGDWKYFAKAESLLTAAFHVATPGSGPLVSRARLHFTLHRFADAAADLSQAEAAVVVLPAIRAGALAVRADLAAQTGHYDEARRLAEELDRARRGPDTLHRLALLDWQTGDLVQAERRLTEADSSYTGASGQYRAWLKLQRGDFELDRGRIESALDLYRQAEELFPGWWLAYGRVARAQALAGQTESAIFAYQELIGRTGDPEFMDQLAEIYRARSDINPFARWLQKSRRLHEGRMERFPEAAIGHALSHYLRLEPDTREAARLAERNRVLRPNGEATTWLAEAYARGGRLTMAVTTIDAVLATPWRSAETWAAASLIHAAAGDEARAQEERRLALEWNPRIFEWLSWFTPGKRAP